MGTNEHGIIHRVCFYRNVQEGVIGSSEGFELDEPPR